MQLDEDMVRMSLLDHLDELRGRILRALAGIGVAFLICVTFTDELWRIVSQPSVAAMAQLGLHEKLVFTTPMEAFSTVWVKLPLLASLFIASPWVLYQLWAFIAPGLYRNERRWAAPFVICTAGLFVAGGLFSYFVAFRYSLAFLVGIGQNLDLQPMLTISEYFDLFINVTLGIGFVFELPALLFLLTLLHVVSPAFLWRNSRYAVIGLALIAAVVSPTQDVASLALLLVPMCALYFAGVFASYGVVFYREGRSVPRKKLVMWIAIVSLLASGATDMYIALR
ncbi:MAG TPA: twin-arginine translocase subunit TatC [Bryobacteraceae bacterium]|nr:twin-arginine translocase subunit TatC [Bryobacteraceae bacterium]